MKWITARELEGWADRIDARDEFPEMVRHLILAAATDIGEIRFPGGDKGQIRGFDGWLEAAGSKPYVPEGRSIWEFGVSKNPKKKFLDDYAKRIKEISFTERNSLTFVFATPRCWDNPAEKLQDWVNEQRKKDDFADVKYYDGIQLEDWLERCQAVGALYARNVLQRIPQTGARSTNEFWHEYSKRYRPELTEDVALCARAAQAEQILAHLLGKPGSLVFIADGPDEVTAVAVAAIRQAPADTRKFLEARTLIVDTEDAGRRLSTPDRYGFVVSPAANKLSGPLAGYGPTVSRLGVDARGQKHARLARPSTREMAKALCTTGLLEEEARLLATKSGRSLTILERHAPAAAFEPPVWASAGSKLLPALLAGGWDSRHTGDTSILAFLGGSDYDKVEIELRQFLNCDDSPLDREAGIWKLRAPVDAFVNLSNFLGAEHLNLLAEVAIKVFSGNPETDSAEFSFGTPQKPYSPELRDGLATTLLMLSVLHEEVALDVGQDPTKFVEELIGGLPGLRDDYRIILSLEAQLPILMEAAPDPLLEALEKILEGDSTEFAPIFIEAPVFGTSHSRLPYLLWALEILAWDPCYLSRVSLVLARLAEVDPGGQLSNRPIASLRSIFLAWNPGTNASLEMQLSVIDMIVVVFPEVGWRLLVELLPKLRDFNVPTQHPRFREAGASEKEIVAPGIVEAAQASIVDRVLASLDATPSRFLEVLESFPQFPSDRRMQFLDQLTEFADRVAGDAKSELHRKLRRLADRHARFRDASWALPDDDFQRLATLVASLESVDPIDRARSLFDEWMPIDAYNYSDAEKHISELRASAVSQVVKRYSSDKVFALASMVRFPRFVGIAASEGIDDVSFLVDLLDRAPVNAAEEEFSVALAGALRRKLGQEFDSKFLEIAREKKWPELKIAVLLLDWPENPATWDMVNLLGRDARIMFWSRRVPKSFEGSSDELAKLIRYFLEVDRPSAALEVLHGREDDLDWPLIVELLKMHVRNTNEGRGPGRFDGYIISQLLRKLRRRDDIGKMDIAQW